MKRNLKKNEAITLISLVVTIIVLIILAGISINLTLGQDGIITKARQAKQNIELAQVEEQEQLNELYSQMIGESINSTSNDAMSKLLEFKKQIASAITDMGVKTSEDADATTMASNIRSISGSSSTDIEFLSDTFTASTKTLAFDKPIAFLIIYISSDSQHITYIDGLGIVCKYGSTTLTKNSDTEFVFTYPSSHTWNVYYSYK